MKKKIAYLTATALACVTIFGAASCGNKGGDSVADLEIYFCQSGAGTEYFEKIVDAFKVKNPDINVVEPLIVNSDYNYLKTALESGASGNSAAPFSSRVTPLTSTKCRPRGVSKQKSSREPP